ncbi:hypothetical protein DFH09DRAFT_1334033 [Mycena vulgaris]|nr:hypothetical protein DFH09DRAFT_1334033 [Mycena vulgaris]
MGAGSKSDELSAIVWRAAKSRFPCTRDGIRPQSAERSSSDVFHLPFPRAESLDVDANSRVYPGRLVLPAAVVQWSFAMMHALPGRRSALPLYLEWSLLGHPIKVSSPSIHSILTLTRAHNARLMPPALRRSRTAAALSVDEERAPGRELHNPLRCTGADAANYPARHRVRVPARHFPLMSAPLAKVRLPEHLPHPYRPFATGTPPR